MNRPGRRGNRHLLERDAEKIAARYLAGEASMTERREERT